MVEFSQSAFSGSETSGVVPVILLLKGGTSTSDITVTVTLSDITAEGKIRCPSLISCFISVVWKGNGKDYDSTPINVTFTAGSTINNINITVNMDNVTETSETFNITFTILSLLSDKVVPGNITTATGSITDDIGKTNV